MPLLQTLVSQPFSAGLFAVVRPFGMYSNSIMRYIGICPSVFTIYGHVYMPAA